VLEILEVVKGSYWGDIEVEIGGSRLKITRSETRSGESAGMELESSLEAVGSEVDEADLSRPGPLGPQGGQVELETDLETDLEGWIAVKPAMAGIFYSSPSPGSPAFASVGETVKEGQQLGIVEVMKLFTPVVAPCSGVIRKILVGNEAFVENNETIMFIEAIAE
jgi:biotin carboxyl carrier protein